MSAYYNEFDSYAAQWLRNLIAAGHIATGDVDERSITEVQPDDLKAYTQCHFFAGIGGWSLALRLAGWPDDRPVWTGSCPCQPLSSAGQRKGHADERHLWPAFHGLISECKPPVVFGEQVASADGREWFAAVRADLETVGYACGAADLCAAGVGAPHIRQRLYWVADATRERCERQSIRLCGRRPQQASPETTRSGADGGLADAVAHRRHKGFQPFSGELSKRIGGGGQSYRMGDADNAGLQEHRGSGDVHLWEPDRAHSGRQHIDAGVDGGEPQQPRKANGFWGDADWLHCRDGKWRAVEPGTFPLANGIPGRVGRLRAYGNAIVPQVAATFISAYSAALTEAT